MQISTLTLTGADILDLFSDDPAVSWFRATNSTERDST